MGKGSSCSRRCPLALGVGRCSLTFVTVMPSTAVPASANMTSSGVPANHLPITAMVVSRTLSTVGASRCVRASTHSCVLPVASLTRFCSPQAVGSTAQLIASRPDQVLHAQPAEAATTRSVDDLHESSALRNRNGNGRTNDLVGQIHIRNELRALETSNHSRGSSHGTAQEVHRIGGVRV